MYTSDLSGVSANYVSERILLANPAVFLRTTLPSELFNRFIEYHPCIMINDQFN